MLIVAGFHRSGTSLVADLLHRGGLFLGDDLLGAMPSNPYGHFEDREFLELHREILEANGESWQVDALRPMHISGRLWQRMQGLVRQRTLAHERWGFKDPRSCLLLGAWKHLVPDARVVVVYRTPGASVYSLERRQSRDLFRGDGPEESHRRFWTEPDHGLRMWLAHNRALLAFVDAHPLDCLVVPFRYLRDGFPIVRAANRRLGAGLRDVPTYAVFDPSATRGRPTPQSVSDQRIRARVESTWAALEARRVPFDFVQ